MSECVISVFILLVVSLESETIFSDLRQRQAATFGFQFQTNTEISAFEIQIFCTIFILKFLYESLLGNSHLVYVEITMLKDRRMGCKEKNAYFSLWCYIYTLRLALSLCTHFLSLYIPTQRAAV